MVVAWRAKIVAGVLGLGVANTPVTIALLATWPLANCLYLYSPATATKVETRANARIVKRVIVVVRARDEKNEECRPAAGLKKARNKCLS